MEETTLCFDDEEFIRRAKEELGCSEHEIGLFLKREEEHMSARGLIVYSEEVLKAQQEEVYFDLAEQFVFLKRTTDLSIETISNLLFLEEKIQAQCGIIDLSEEELKELDDLTFSEDIFEYYDKLYDFSYLMYKIGYMYENGVGFDQDNTAAEEWYQRAYNNGWSDDREFVFEYCTPEPLVKKEA